MAADLITKSCNGVTYTIDKNRVRRIQPLRAKRAMDKLLADGEDTVQAFEIVQALGGNSLEKNFRRFLNTPTGPALFERRDELAPMLDDHDWLRALPPGSFGRAYLDFVTSENLSAAGLVAESEKVENRQDYEAADDLAWYGRRLRDTHDLWHVLSGYGRDGLGEICLLAFSYSQSRNIGLLFMAYSAAAMYKKELGDDEPMQAMWSAKRDGKRAANLAALDYREALTRPLEEVRKACNIGTPERYKQIFPAIDAYFKEQALV